MEPNPMRTGKSKQAELALAALASIKKETPDVAACRDALEELVRLIWEEADPRNHGGRMFRMGRLFKTR